MYLKNIEVDTDMIFISSNFVCSKTESFLSQTKKLLNIDFFASKIAESLLSNINTLKITENAFLKLETTDKSFGFLVKIVYSKSNNLNQVIFAKFLNNGDIIRHNDTRIQDYLEKNKKFDIYVSTVSNISNENFEKLYRLFDSQDINFPLLSTEQLELIKISDQNVIIQGVAGSGKTNVCIEKLIWCALKNYGGKVLYTTFSRGLLNDTKLKIEEFKTKVVLFLEKLKKGKVIFLDDNHKTAVENYLGVFLFSSEEAIQSKLEKIISFFEKNVDYFLIYDLYSRYFDTNTFANEKYFENDFIKNIKNYQVQNSLSKLKHLSYEIIYKEIFGIIFGFCSMENKRISKDDYIELRKNSFSKQECEIIFLIAKEYEKHLNENNMLDNNLASWRMFENFEKIDRYSLIIADEVQDFSQITLKLFKKISLKLFCTGDALQMINPSYFSFGYLKNLMYEKDLVSVAELQNNYRNTKKIQHIIDELEKVNNSIFGIHNFITKGVGIDTAVETKTVFCEEKNLIPEISKNKLDTFTIVVSSNEKKNELRKSFQNQEILTISEIKGLERDSVLLYDLLSDNSNKWNYLIHSSLNKKTADENSIFRFYFNLFYVGASRAKHNLFVVEEQKNSLFADIFAKNFESKNKTEFLNTLLSVVGKIEFTQDEYLDRIAEFVKLEQFDNAKFTANKITDDVIRKNQLIIIDINQNYVSIGKYREAGIKFWESGLIDEAKKQFTLSGDKILIDFIDALNQNNQTNLNYEIVKYFLDVKDNDIAKKFVLEILQDDYKILKDNQKDISNQFKKLRGDKNGK